MHFLRFAHPQVLLVSIPLVLLAAILRERFRRPARYVHPLGSILRKKGPQASSFHRHVFFFMRILSLLVLALLVAKPQWVDVQSQVKVEGIDIVLTMDVSGSMSWPFGMGSRDDRSRFDVAKEEAMRFIDKRDNDALGLVLFGNGAISRAPLTLDRKILQDTIAHMQLGDVVDPEGTALFTGMVTAANRLKKSKAKSKVMILLTDGAPLDDPTDPQTALDVVKKMGIKIYTVGIGSEWTHPFYGKMPGVDEKLLEHIAKETGGKSFMAHDARDMRHIYETIDSLERVQQELPLFSSYYDLFAPFATMVFATLIGELLLSSFVWFGI